MDTLALRWFTEVADGASVTEVAELHAMSQPGVSRALSRLERDVGTALFVRVGRSLVLTPAGRAFHAHISRALGAIDDGLSAVAQLLDPETGTVTLAFQPSLGTWLVPDVIGSFRPHHPEVRFDMRAKPDERIPAIAPGSGIDLELSTLAPSGSEPGTEGEPRSGSDSGSGSGSDSGRAWFPLLDEPLRLLLPADHRFAAAGAIGLDSVREDPFVTLRETSLLRSQVEELCRAAGFAPSVSVVADDLPTLRGYVASGLGVAVLPSRWHAGAEEPTSPYVRYLDLLDSGASRTVGLSWSTEHPLLPAAEMFRTHIIDRADSGDLPTPAPTR